MKLLGYEIKKIKKPTAVKVRGGLKELFGGDK